jgi:hypothetical protein
MRLQQRPDPSNCKEVLEARDPDRLPFPFPMSSPNLMLLVASFGQEFHSPLESKDLMTW